MECSLWGYVWKITPDSWDSVPQSNSSFEKKNTKQWEWNLFLAKGMRMICLNVCDMVDFIWDG